MTMYELQSMNPCHLEKLIHNMNFIHFPCQSDGGCEQCECHIDGDKSTYCLGNPIFRASILKLYFKRCTDIGVSPTIREFD